MGILPIPTLRSVDTLTGSEHPQFQTQLKGFAGGRCSPSPRPHTKTQLSDEKSFAHRISPKFMSILSRAQSTAHDYRLTVHHNLPPIRMILYVFRSHQFEPRQIKLYFHTAQTDGRTETNGAGKSVRIDKRSAVRSNQNRITCAAKAWRSCSKHQDTLRCVIRLPRRSSDAVVFDYMRLHINRTALKNSTHIRTKTHLPLFDNTKRTIAMRRLSTQSEHRDS